VFYFPSNLLLLCIWIWQIVNKLIYPTFCIASIQHIHIPIISILYTYIISFISTIINIIFKYIIILFTFKPTYIIYTYISRLFIICCNILRLYLLILFLVPFYKSVFICYCCLLRLLSYYLSVDNYVLFF
jgi:hypothetical protein